MFGFDKKAIAFLVIVVVVVVIVVVAVVVVTQALNGSQTAFSATLILDRIDNLSILTTTRYNYSSIVNVERDMPGLLAGLYGERLVMVAVGHVTAGIDLSQLEREDVEWEEDTISIRTPAPALQDCFLNEQASYVVSRDTGLFAAPAPNMDSEARVYAVRQFREMAIEDGILDEVQSQAEVAIRELMSALQVDGLTRVRVIPSDIDPNTPLPNTCA